MYTAVIPVRAGSRRVKDKNIRPFGDSNLLIHKIRQLKLVDEIDNVYVSSDSPEMLQMASDEGVLIHERSWEYCDEKTAPFGEVVKNVCENIEGEQVLWTLCTAPLILPEHYQQAIDIYKTLENHDSLIAVKPFKKYVWDDAGPVNFEMGKGHIPSQELPQYYFTTGLRIAPRKDMIDWAYFTGSNPYKLELPELNCIDIDEESDLEIAGLLYEKYFK